MKIVGYSSVTRLAATASSLYARNLYAFVETLIDKANKTLAVNWDDELVKATLLTRDGAIVHPNFQAQVGATRRPPLSPGEPDGQPRRRNRQTQSRRRRRRAGRPAQCRAYADQLAAAGHAATGGAIDPFVFRLAIFALAVFVGYYVVWSVTPALHTPLMSVTNAISSVIVVGALLSVGVAGGRQRLGLRALRRLHRADPRLGEHLRRLPRHRAHARDVQEEGLTAVNANLAALLYLVAGILFILALRGLSSPASSRQGNRFGMIGMAIAVLTTLALKPPAGFVSWLLVIVGLAIGGGIGAWRARTVQMTAMPQLVAMFHSLVGLAAVLVAAGALYAPQAFGIGEGGASIRRA